LCPLVQMMIYNNYWLNLNPILSREASPFVYL
jgi:hypothetical protein